MTWLDAILVGLLVAVLIMGIRRQATRAYLRINPKYRLLLGQHGLTTARAVLGWPAVIVSGHPDRNVSRLTLSAGGLTAYLKREHHVSWKQRLTNWWAGFGLVSLSHREAATLHALERSGLGCPDWIAVGADGRGRAFLLIAALEGCVDLRRFLADESIDACRRRFLARRLAETLTRVHAAGFAHPDLYAKHVFIDPDHGCFLFLDWQRAGRRHRVSKRERWRDLAALDATLADDLAGPRERLALLHTYVKCAFPAFAGRRHILRRVLSAVYNRRHQMLQRRHVREARRLPDPAAVKQELIWLDGEALCMTPDFYRETGGQLPYCGLRKTVDGAVSTTTVELPRGRQARFVRRRGNRLLAWFKSLFWGRIPSAPEVREAGLLFRLQRYGVPTAPLLAFGQRVVLPWRVESFLLTEISRDARALQAQLIPGALPVRWRAGLLRETGRLLRRLHEAGCYLGNHLDGDSDENPRLTADPSDSEGPRITLNRVDGFRLAHRPAAGLAVADLAALVRCARTLSLSRSDLLRVALAYLGESRLTPEGKQKCAGVVRRHAEAVPA
jgi:tRNA A-37 threonylcarbamoyl transferase component Bud32